MGGTGRHGDPASHALLKSHNVKQVQFPCSQVLTCCRGGMLSHDSQQGSLSVFLSDEKRADGDSVAHQAQRDRAFWRFLIS